MTIRSIDLSAVFLMSPYLVLVYERRPADLRVIALWHLVAFHVSRRTLHA